MSMVEGWKKNTLQEIGELIYGSGIREHEYNYAGESLVFGTGGIIAHTDQPLNYGPAIIIGRKGTIDNKFYVPNKQPFWAIDTTYYFKTEEDTKYLFYVLSTINLANYSEATGVPSLSRNTFYRIAVKVPTSKAEQRQIAAVLSTVDEAIAQTERLLAKHERLKTGLMQDLLTRGIDEQGRLRHPDTHAFKDSPLGRIPVEWEVKTLNELFDEIKSGGTPSRKRLDFFAEGQIPWVKTLDLNEGIVHDTDECITPLALESSACSLMPKGTLMIAMYGGWEQIGRTSLLGLEAATNQAISSLAKPKENVLSRYCQFFLQRNRSYWKKVAVSTRKDPNITKSDILNFSIAIPTSLEEQKQATALIEAEGNNINSLKFTLQKLRSLKTALMQDLLTGRVRVDSLLETLEESA